MELHQLRYFVAVAEAGTMSRAAQRCGVAQPSLSQQLRKLETALGAELFDRLPRGVSLTDAGRALLPRARRILAETRDVEAALRRDIESGAGPLAIGAIPTIAPYILPRVLERFAREHNRCELTVREDLTERLVEALLAGELDCALVSTPVEEPRIELTVVATERLVAAVPLDHALAREDSITIGALHDEPTVVLHEMHCLGQQIQGFCASRGWRQRIVCRSTQLSTVLKLVELGMGISIVPEMAADDDDRGGVRYIPIRRAGPRRDIAIAWRSGRSRSFLAERFAEALIRDVSARREQKPAPRTQPEKSEPRTT